MLSNQTNTYIFEKKLLAGYMKIRPDGILLFEPFDDIKKIDIEALQSDIKEFIEYADGTKLPYLYDARGLFEFTSKQKAFLNINLPHFSSKMAILTGNSLSVFSTNLFIMFYKSTIPIKAFKKFDKAILWLKD